MRHLKLWTIISIFLGISSLWAKFLFFNKITIPSFFSGDLFLTLNNLGAYFGASAMIVWLGGVTVISDKIMTIGLIIGGLTLSFILTGELNESSPGALLLLAFWPLGITVLFILL